MSEIIFRKAGMLDVKQVVGNMSDLQRKEIEASPYDMRTFLMIVSAHLRAGHADAIMLDDVPQGIFMVAKVNGRISCILLSTDDFFAKCATKIKSLKTYLKKIRTEYGPLCTHTTSPHPDSERWLALLGFRPEEGENGVTMWVWT